MSTLEGSTQGVYRAEAQEGLSRSGRELKKETIAVERGRELCLNVYQHMYLQCTYDLCHNDAEAVRQGRSLAQGKLTNGEQWKPDSTIAYESGYFPR